MAQWQPLAAVLEDLCMAIAARRFLNTRTFTPELQSELVSRAEAEITRYMERATRILAEYDDGLDEYGDEGDEE